MVPYDKSEHAKKALEFATDLAKKYSSKISLVTFVPLNPDYSDEGTSYAENIEVVKRSAVHMLAQLEHGLQELEIPHEIKVLEGTSVVETLLSYAEAHHVGIIVMGSRGLGGFKKLFLGSVASGLTQHSKCPVLIVK